MRCPNCSYFNLPGSPACGLCGFSLRAARSTAPPAFQDVYPPRARNRSPADRLELAVARPLGSTGLGRRIRAFREAFARQIAVQNSAGWPDMRSRMLTSLIVTLSVAPGIVQLCARRTRIGLVLLIGSLLCALAAWHTIKSPISNMMAGVIIALMVVSVWDMLSASVTEPAVSKRAASIIIVRRLLQTAFTVSFAVLSVLLPLTAYYSTYSIQSAVEAPTLITGDQVVTSNSTTGIRRGDIVLARNANDYEITERVLGLPGDTVAWQNGQISVNGKPLAAALEPLGQHGVGLNQAITVPKSSVCIWNEVAGRIYGNDMSPVTDINQLSIPTSLAILPDSSLEGRVLMIIEPPARRRLL